MVCLKCENEKFKNISVKIEQEFNGQNFNIVIEGTVCVKCGFTQFDDDQANKLRRETLDGYNKNNDLLTSRITD